jgi:hypothetical protein
LCFALLANSCWKTSSRPENARAPIGRPKGRLSQATGYVAPGARAFLILDSAGFHIARDLIFSGNVALARPPPYAPELNPVEYVWQCLRGGKLFDTVYDNYEYTVDKACEAWMLFANDKDRVASITTRRWAQVAI